MNKGGTRTIESLDETNCLINVRLTREKNSCAYRGVILVVLFEQIDDTITISAVVSVTRIYYYDRFSI
jgi:hypothetical protein